MNIIKKTNIISIAFLLVIAILCSFSLNAQKMRLSDSKVTYNEKERPCIEVQIEPETKMTKKNMINWIDDQYNVSLKGMGFLTNKDVLTAEGVVIKPVSDKKMDLFVQVVEQKDETTKMCVFGSFGYNIHITPQRYPVEYNQMKEMTIQFLEFFLPNYYENQIESQQEVVKDISKEREKLAKEIAKNEKEIEKLEEGIEETEKTMKDRARKLEEAEETLEEKKKKLKEVKEELEEEGKGI